MAALILLPVLSSGTDFAVNPYRQDPYKRFKFRVRWDGQYISGISYVSGLTRSTQVSTFRDGSDASVIRRLPGQTEYEPIILERGRTHDTAFEVWSNKVWNLGSGQGSEVSLGDFRKDMIIDLYNEAGQLAMSFRVYNCWPSAYSALTELESESRELAIERLVLQHEGWERDYAVAEPTEPSFTEPQ